MTFSINGLRIRIVVTARAPQENFFTLISPFPEGHRENYLTQSFQVKLDVEISERQVIIQ
jgi:tocopherol cyclase